MSNQYFFASVRAIMWMKGVKSDIVAAETVYCRQDKTPGPSDRCGLPRTSVLL